jgi:hypothetical protein
MPVDLIARGLGATDAELGVGRPEPPVYRVFLRDPAYNIVDELDAWISLDLVIRWNAIGTWRLEIANDTRTVSAVILQKASGIVVRRDGLTILSGSVTSYTRTATTIVAAGEDDMALLRELALPDPLTSPPYPDAYDVVTAQASAVMRNLVNNNIGPAARADRKVAALQLAADPHLGSTITARAGFQPLITLLSEMAITPLAGGLGFRIHQSDTTPNTLDFVVYASTDRSADAKFGTELGTAQDYEDTWTAPAANAPYVLLGDGLAGTRTVLEDVDTFSIAESGRRFETMIDRRDVTDPTEGAQALAEAMAQTSSSRKVTITPIDVPSLQYGTEWELGDLVTFAVNGETFIDLVREVDIQLTPDRGTVVKPLIGQQGATNDSETATYISSVQNRLTNLERNWAVPDDSIDLAMMQADSVGAVQIVAGSVTPSHLAAIDLPADRQALGWDSASGGFVWLNGSEIAGSGAFVDLTVTGNTILGDNAAVDTLAVNAIATFNGTVTLKNTLLIENASLTPLAWFDTANQRAIIGSATPLGSAPNDKLSVIGGTTYFVGASGASIGIRYVSTDTAGWTISKDGAGANQDLLFLDDGGAEIVRIGDTGSTYQLKVSGVTFLTKSVTIGTGTGDSLDVLGGISAGASSAFTGGVTIVTGGLTVSAGNSSFAANLTGTAGTFRWEHSGTARIEADSTGLGLFGATPISRPTVTGVRTGTLAQLQAAFASLTSALDGSHLGAITDLTT